MDIPGLLGALGISRVIWIDDKFKKEAELADMLMSNLGVAEKSKFPGFAEILERFQISNDDGELRQFLLDLKPEEEAILKEEFFGNETAEKHLPAAEMRPQDVQQACQFLGVSADDQWTFQQAHAQLKGLCEAGDHNIAYLVDLNEAGGSPTEGLHILQNLRTHGSRGTAFILTHEATAATEGAVEERLRGELREPGGATAKPIDIPVCVVSKERISDNPELENALKIAIKRAGLRRSVHEVLSGVGDVVERGCQDAAEMLLQIPPEQLDRFVVERGHVEGVSELHVLERAITAKIAERLRTMFATDSAVNSATARVRALRAVTLTHVHEAPHANLAEFRKMEVWESSELLNNALTPIASGDVFELVLSELNKGTAPRRFILLGQPCDIAMRWDGKRDQNTAFFIPLKIKPAAAAVAAEGRLKEAVFQFQLDGDQWVCDFRASTMVNLTVLDLASMRQDGCVRVDEGQTVPAQLLPGLAAVASFRLAAAFAYMAKQGVQPGPVQELAFQLAFRSDEMYKNIHAPKLLDAVQGQGGMPRRVTWSLKRAGRVRMPHASAVLRDFLAMSGREAFDLDFAKPAPAPSPPSEAPQAKLEPAAPAGA